jgi:FAD-dependent oxidoreductase domain-containing protein 1
VKCTLGAPCSPKRRHRSGTDFLRNAERLLAVDGEDTTANAGGGQAKACAVDVQFKENGYLFLASPQGLSVLESNHKIQRDLGSHIEFLASPSAIKTKFPYLHTEVTSPLHKPVFTKGPFGLIACNPKDLSAGCHGVSGEGWFDPATLLQGFKRKAISLGVNYVHGEVHTHPT